MSSRNGYSSLDGERTPAAAIMMGAQSVGTASKSTAKKKRVSFQGSEKAPLLSTSVPQNVKNKNVYVFSDGTMGEDEGEEVELTSMMRSRDFPDHTERSYKSTSSNQFDNVSTTEIPIVKDDTLASIAIRFRCPVSELKRINGLMSDKEFFALKHIKIPIRSHQKLLQEELELAAQERAVLAAGENSHRGASIVSTSDEDEVESQINTEEYNMDQHTDDEDTEALALLDRYASRSQIIHDKKKDRKQFDKFMSKTDGDIGRISEQVQNHAAAIEEVTSLMRTSPTFPEHHQRPQKQLLCIELTPLRLLVCGGVLLAIIIACVWYTLFDHQSE